MRFYEYNEPWKMIVLDSIINEVKETTSNFNKYPLCSFTIESGVIPKTDRYERGFLVKKDGDLFKIVHPNNFVMNPMNLRFGAINYSKLGTDVSVSGYYDIFNIDEGLFNSFWSSYLRTPKTLNRYNSIATGSLVEKKRVHFSQLKELKFYIPCNEEKTKINDFINLLEQRIDTQIKIIEEYKTLKDSLNKRLIDNSKGNFTLENCIVSNTSNLKESDVLNFKNGIYPVYGANGIIKYIDKYDINQRSISIVKDGAGVGRLQYHEGKYSIIGTLNYLTSKGLFDLKYIYYAMKNINFKNYVVGTGIPHIYFKDYKKEKIKIKTNEEINRIVKILTDIDEYIYLQEKLLDKLMIEKKFLLNNLFV